MSIIIYLYFLEICAIIIVPFAPIMSFSALFPLLLSNWSPVVLFVVILIVWGEIKFSKLSFEIKLSGQRLEALEKQVERMETQFREDLKELHGLLLKALAHNSVKT